jgi:hypothetical protein
MSGEWAGRRQWGSGMTAGVSLEQDGVVWCPSCGIPHEAGATHCSFCKQPLAEGIEGEAESAESLSAASDTDTGVLARAIADRVATQRSPRTRSAGPWALPRRPQPLTEDEIEARAAAIVAQARNDEASGAAVPLFTDGYSTLSDDELLELDFLPPLRQRDREWLLAGAVCCVILILGAVVIARYFAA